MEIIDKRESVRRQALDEGMPADLADRWISLARPRLVFDPMSEADRNAGAAVAGWYGGHPQLPADTDWTGYPHYLASIDCAALPADLVDLPLPKEGTLLLFVDRDEPVGGRRVGMQQGRRVRYVPPGTPVRTRRLDEAHGEPDHYRGPFPLACTLHWDLPETENPPVMLSEDLHDLIAPYLYELEADESESGVLSIGGYTGPPQDDPCVPLSDGKLFGVTEWCAFAQWWANVDGTAFGTYMVIPREDLEQHRYDRVVAETQLEKSDPLPDWL